MNQQAAPKGMFPCWYITEEELEKVRTSGKPFVEYTNTEDFFQLTNRIDATFIQGYIARRDKQYALLGDIRARYSYLLDYYDRKRVYFTFDRINLYQLRELYPSHPNPTLFTLKRVDALKAPKRNQAFMIMPFHNENIRVKNVFTSTTFVLINILLTSHTNGELSRCQNNWID